MPKLPFVLLLLSLLWAGLYLPALGETELKGEEPRRIVPGLLMIQSGDWLHTTIGATPYMRKPPLVNWAIAGSVLATGQYSELAYRLPSVLAVLLLVLGTAAFTWRWLGPGGALLAGIFILTNISMLEKGRLAEIEAIYIACGGLAIAWWLPRFARGEGGWAQWAVPGLFLGLGMLAKGPAHFLYFYAVVIGACWASREWRTLWHPGHFLCLALAAGIFAAWAIPYAQSGPTPTTDPETAQVGAAWISQLTSRLGFDDFKPLDWALNVPRGILNLLPWALFFPLLWNKRWLADLADDRERAILRGARNGVVASFIAVSLMPGALERYTLPLLVPIFLLLARVMVTRNAPQDDANPVAPRWMRVWSLVNRLALVLGFLGLFAVVIYLPDGKPGSLLLLFILFPTLGLAQSFLPGPTPAIVPWLFARRAPGYPSKGILNDTRITGLTFASALVLVILVTTAAIQIAPRLRASDNLRPLRAEVLTHVPPGARLWVQDSGWRPFWAYLFPEARFYTRFKEAPFGPEPLALLVKDSAAPKVAADSRFRTRPGTVVHTLQDNEGNKLALVTFPAEPKTP
jgi:4-amino-4-deoxy-L-arabinose transferase-like glycosyltransferase